MKRIADFCLQLKDRLESLGDGKARREFVEACREPAKCVEGDVYIRIRSDMKYVSPIRAMVDAVCIGANMSEDDREDLKLAVGEAVVNAVEHGSPRAGKDFVCIACSVNHDGVTVSVSDSGGRFYAKRAKRRSGGLRERGYGLLLIRKLTSAVQIHADRRGATVTMEKRFSATA